MGNEKDLEDEDLRPQEKLSTTHSTETSRTINSNVRSLKGSGKPVLNFNNGIEVSKRGSSIHIPEVSSVSGAESLNRGVEALKKKRFTCPPVADTYANIRNVLNEDDLLLGYTKIDKSSKLLCAPDFIIDKARGTCSYKRITVNLSATSKFLEEVKKTPSGVKMKQPGCGKREVPIYYQISNITSAQAEAAEKEHCEDLNRAFNQTLKPCAKAVNRFAGAKLPGKNDTECFKSLASKIGFDPFSCNTEFVTLANKTQERDDNGWHDFDPFLIRKNCKEILVGLRKAKTAKIGDPAYAPEKFIPAATKCSRPAPKERSIPKAPSGKGK